MQDSHYKYSLIFIILLLGGIIFIEMLPFLSGVLGALTLYILVRKQMKYFTETKKMGVNLSAFIIILEVILCFIVPIFLIIWLFISKLQTFNIDTNSFIASIQSIVNAIQSKTGYDILSGDNIKSATAYAAQIMQTVIGEISSFIINSLVLVFILYFMLIGNKTMEAYVYDLMPFSDKNKKAVATETKVIVQSNAIGIPLLAIVQGVFACIGYLIFDTPSPMFFALITCFATIIPLIGTAMVWFPLVVYLAVTGNWPMAIGLAAYSLLVISNIDNLVRFLLQKKIADTHPLITIFGVVVGLSLFGFWGVIFGPLLLSMFILCLNMFKKEHIDTRK